MQSFQNPEVGKGKKVLMIGPARTVRGGVSAVVNHYYEAGLDRQVDLRYIATMEDGSKLHKLFTAAKAVFIFFGCVRDYDIVHVNMASDVSIYRKMIFIWIARWYGKKIIIHQHGGNIKEFYFHQCSPRQQKRIRKTLLQAEKLLVIAPYLQEIFEQIVDKDRIVLLPNAILIPDKVKKDYRGQKLLFLGRLCKEKGIGELLQACKELHKAFPRLELYLGGVWEEPGLKQQADEMGDWVHQPGWVGRAEKDRLLKECNIFLLPSYFEGHPVSLLEGMAYGCACIATDIGGVSQMLSDGENGLLVPAKDTIALQKAIEICLHDTELQRKLGAKALERIEKEYDLKKNIQRLVEIYQSL